MTKFDPAAFLQSGRSLDELFEVLTPSALSPQWNEINRRCALLRLCDAQSYAEAAAGIEAPPFPEWCASNGVTAVSGEKKQFTLSPQLREELLGAWLSTPQDLATFAARMRTHYLRRKNELGALTMNLFVDPAAAEKQFNELYRTADEAFDTPTCAMLLEILRVRYILLAPNLQTLWRRTDSYKLSRALFADDYYRSAAFLERDDQRKGFESFWDGSVNWLLRLYGKGGSGKTMFIRWLIARRCLPRKPGQPPITVARVDFDFLDLNAFSLRPWLLLVPIARQLSPQLDGNPFQSLVSEFGRFLPLLASSDSTRSELASEIDGRRARLIQDFRSALGAASVLLVLDTCEEPLIHRRAAFESLLEILAEARQLDCPNLRVLVSGRYDVGGKDRLPRFAGSAEPIIVKAFTVKESKRYLTDRRGLPKGRLVNVIAARANGNPFALGLFADLAASPEGLTVQDVLDAPSNEFIYLLDRVILRIPDEPVRWLVRYAVVTRELTFDFVAKVLSRLLADTSADNANDFNFEEKLRRRYESRKPWPEARISELKDVWNKLVAYASNPSWIVWKPESDSLKLQAEVVAPMRELLRRQNGPFDDILRDAELYWRNRAAEHFEEFVPCIINALFQRLLREGRAAEKEWWTLLDHRDFQSTAARKQLGELILDSSFIDPAGNPLPHPDAGLLVTPDMVLKARFLVSFAALSERLQRGRAVVDGSQPGRELEDQWAEISKRGPDSLGRAGTNSEYRLLQTGFTYFVKRTLVPLSRLHSLRLPDNLRLLACLLAARLQYERVFHRLPSSDKDFLKALELSSSLRSAEFPRGHIQYRLGLYYLRVGNLASTVSAFRAGLLGLPNTEPFFQDRLECFWRSIAALRRMGRWQDASSLIDEVGSMLPPLSSVRVQQAHARASVALDMGDLDNCLASLSNAMDHHGYLTANAAVCELAAERAIAALDLPQAAGYLDQAFHLYSDTSHGRVQIRLLQAAAQLAVGNRRQALDLLPRQPVMWDLYLEWASLRIRAGARMPELPAPSKAPAEALAKANALALAHGKAKSVYRFLKVLDALERPARFAALVPFGETDHVLTLSESEAESARTSLPTAPRDLSHPAAVLQAIALANALRFFNDAPAALRLLRRIPEQKGLTEWWRLRALQFASPQQEPDTLAAFLETQESAPISEAFRFAVYVDVAEWRLGRDDRPGAQICATRLARPTPTLDRSKGTLAARAAAVLSHFAARQSIHPAFSAPPPDRSAFGTPADEWQFTFTQKARQFAVKFELLGRGGGRFVHDSPSWLGPDLEPLLGIRDWAARTAELAALTAPFQQHTTPAGARLRLEANAIAAVPWEYLAPPNCAAFTRAGLTPAAAQESIRWLQLALNTLGSPCPVNGDISDVSLRTLVPAQVTQPGERLQPLLRARLKEKHLDPLAGDLALVEPDSEWQYSHKSGYLMQSLPLRRIFAAMPSNDDFTASVLDIVGVFRRDSSGEVVLDCGNASRTFAFLNRNTDSTALRVDDIAAPLINLPPNVLRPFVILDALAQTAYDAPQQAILRNYFCIRLFATGAARAVLGFGLAIEGHAKATLDSLLQSFTTGKTVGETHAALLQIRDRFYVPPALWTDDSDLPALKS